MTFWFVECAIQPAEPEIIATKLKERYRPSAYEYGLNGTDAELTDATWQLDNLRGSFFLDRQSTSCIESHPLDVYG